MLAHGSVLKDKFYSSEQLNEIIINPDSRLLTPIEKAIMRFSEKIVLDATSVNQNDIDNLKNLGLKDEEIFEIVTVTTALCFFSKTLDALGAEPDRIYMNLNETLRNNLTVGRSIPI
jgi:alkylhydroperoxidase family enzyme